MRLSGEQALRLIAALPGDNPCGVSARDDPDYEWISEEIGKTQSMAGGTISWSGVASRAYTILSEKSKDMALASYFAYAEFEVDGYRGLQYGLGLLDSLLEDYWEQCYPDVKRLRGRLGALEWMAALLEKAVVARSPTAAESEAILSVSSLLDAITEKLRLRFQGKEPDLGAIATACRRYAADVKRATAGQSSAAAATTAPTVATTSSSGAVAQMHVSSEQDIGSALVHVHDLLLEAVTFLLEHDLKDERLYRLNRLAVWLSIEALPPHEDGVTQIGSSIVAEAEAFDMQLAGGHYEVLVRAAEECVGRAPFWLDSHRYVAAGLAALGPLFAPARQAVLAGLGSFLLRFPDVLTMKFLDGVPFADEKTRLWIETEVLPSSGASGNSAQTGVGGTQPVWEIALREAKVLSSKGDDAGALELFSKGLSQSGRGRDRFMWALQRAAFSLTTGQVEAALAQYEQLEREGQARGLSQWEPDLAVQIYSGVLTCVDRFLEKRENVVLGMVPKVRDAFGRLCELDVAKAVEFSQRSGIKKVFSDMYEPERR